ncbi:MAG: putative LPS assembly protein LptD [Luteibaculaceae bacterium]
MRILALLVTFFWLFTPSLLAQQQDSIPLPDSLSAFVNFPFIALPDSLNGSDSLKTPEKPKRPSPIESQVNYYAEDSTITDTENGKMLLYGKAWITYGKIRLDAEVIEYSFNAGEVFAYGRTDSSGAIIGRPKFKEGADEFNANTIRYNFKSQKAYLEQIDMDQELGTLTGKRVKKDADDIIYVGNGTFCPCEDPDALTKFHLSRIMVIPDKKIISGPGILKIGKIPTPLAIPFGFFPNTKTASAGILIPNFGESVNQGVFLQGLGFYTPLGERADLAIKGDYYSFGSYAFDVRSRYITRYKFSGNVNLQYNYITFGERDFPDFAENTNFFIMWSHVQDPKSNPNYTVSADVNFGSVNNFQTNLSSTTTQFLSNTFQSNIRYSQRLTGTPFNFNTNLRHSQNSQTGNFDLTLPQFNLTMARVFLPLGFLKPEGVTRTRWYEKIGINYTADFENRITLTDEQFREANIGQWFGDARNGVIHRANAVTSLKKWYLTFNPSVNYNEFWYFNYVDRVVDEETGFAALDTINRFIAGRDVAYNLNVTTKLYGMYKFKNKNSKVEAVRHVVTPQVGFTYRPEMGQNQFGTFNRFDGENIIEEERQFNRFQTGLFGGPNSIESGTINFSLLNSVEAKVKAGKRDTVSKPKIVRVIENFRVTSFYDLARDSLRWSNVRFDGRTTLFNVLNLNYRGVLDPYLYVFEENQAIRVNRSLFSETGQLGRMVNQNLAAGINLRSKNKPPTADDANKLIAAVKNFRIPWNLGVNYSVDINRRFVQGVEETILTQALMFNGTINLFEKARISFTSGYDFVNQEISYTSVDLYLDLNCWELTANYIPFGFRTSYNLQLNIKASAFKDLRLQRQRNLGGENLLL